MRLLLVAVFYKLWILVQHINLVWVIIKVVQEIKNNDETNTPA